MTDIDLTAAKMEAARRWPSRNIRDPLSSDWLNEGMASGFVLGTQWALAQVEARVKPTRDEIARIIWTAMEGGETEGRTDGPLDWDYAAADAVLALLPGKTEQEVREEVAREHEEKMDRLLEGEWQAGYVAGNNNQLNGTICGRRRAANEGIARGGEQT